MIRKIALLTLFAVMTTASLFAQEEAAKKLKDKKAAREIDNGWTVESALGLDLSQTIFVNPRASAGQNELGFGGLLSFAAAYRKDKFVWDNYAGMELGVKRFGRKNNVTDNPFQKTTDVLRIASKPAYAITSDYKWYGAIEGAFESQLLPAYTVNEMILLNGPDENLTSRFLAPAVMTVSPGIEFKPDEHFSLLMSPASLRLLIVGDDFLAAKGTLGNPVYDDGTFDNVDVQIGASIKAAYKNTFLKDRLVLQTSIYLFQNYIKENDAPTFARRSVPVVQWLTSVDIKIVEGLSIGIATALDYDYNQKVKKDWDPNNLELADGTILPPGYRTQTEGVQFKEHLYIKYTKILTNKKKDE